MRSNKMICIGSAFAGRRSHTMMQNVGERDILDAMQNILDHEYDLDYTIFAEILECGGYSCRGGVFCEASCEIAAARGHLAILEWLCSQLSLEVTTAVSYAAAVNGHFEVVRWVIDNNHPLDEMIMSTFAPFADIREMKMLRDWGVPIDTRTCAVAAGADRMDVLRWALENGGKLNDGSSRLVARMGKVSMMKYIVENGARVSTITVDCAISRRHWDMALWLIDGGCEYSDDLWTQEAAIEMCRRRIFASWRCLVPGCGDTTPREISEGLCAVHRERIARILQDPDARCALCADAAQLVLDIVTARN